MKRLQAEIKGISEYTYIIYIIAIDGASRESNVLISSVFMRLFIERQTPNENEWQQVTASGTKSDKKWQRVTVVQRLTTEDSEWYNEWH